MSNDLAIQENNAPVISSDILEALVQGDISKLTSPQRVQYYATMCGRLGIDPTFKPFDYLMLNGKMVLYANKSCAEQLRKTKSIDIKVTGRETVGDVYVVTAQATLPDGRQDESTGAVTIGNLKSDNLANALMKAETKAKRRVTLSICGLGMLDETELETVRGAKQVTVDGRPDTSKPVPLGLSVPPRAPSGADIRALYAEARKLDPTLPEGVREWAAKVIPGYDPTKNPTSTMIVQMDALLKEMLENGVPVPQAAPEPAAPTESTPAPAEPVQQPLVAEESADAPAPFTPMSDGTRKHLMGILNQLGLKDRDARLKWAADNGMPVDSFTKLSEADATLLGNLASAELANGGDFPSEEL